MKSAKRYWKVPILLVLAGAVVACLTWPRSAFTTPASEKEGAVNNANPLPMVGTASCSARGCHGSIEPRADNKDSCLQDEYSRWIQDRHADAYRVLYEPRSVRMAKLLGGPPAHENKVCLACHTNPMVAHLPQNSLFVKEEKLFGVGCESCHGSANQWLVSHTRTDWRAIKETDAKGMVDLTNIPVRVQVCAGCHVGAAPGKDTHGRDVNHDLIAAGHPRLAFEFDAYQANMPPHWRPEKTIPEGKHWAEGQLASAKAALALLEHRAKSDAAPWPEFAEYDCFACHHNLVSDNWRARAFGKRRPGALPWGSWYFALMPQLADDSAALDDLTDFMQQPFPARQAAAKKAKHALAKLRTISKDASIKSLLANLPEVSSWDRAEQLYLGLYALNRAQPDAAVTKVLTDLADARAFPAGLDSPLSSSPGIFDPVRFYKSLESLRGKIK